MNNNLVDDKLTTSGKNAVLSAFTHHCENLNRVGIIDRAFERLQDAQTHKRPQTPAVAAPALLEKKLIGVWCVHNEHEPSIYSGVCYERGETTLPCGAGGVVQFMSPLVFSVGSSGRVSWVVDCRVQPPWLPTSQACSH